MVRPPHQTDRRTARGPRLRAAALTLGLSSLTAHAQNNPIEPQALPQLLELFWSLILLMMFVLAAIIWVGLIRRNVRQQTETIRQREAALEEHYRELFENAHDIIFTHDLEGNLTSLNAAGEEILGYSREEAAGLNFAQLVAPPHAAAFRNLLSRLAEGRTNSLREIELQAKDGHRVVLRINLRLQRLAGKPTLLQGIAWDITEQKQAEEALRESEQRLRRSLEERVRIGRDLHDGIIQSIYAMGLSLGECRRLIREDPGQAQCRLAKSVEELNSVIRDVRNFIVGLEPEALKGQEFHTALKSLVATMSETHGCTFDIDPGAADCLSARQATEMLQIAREALSNSVRHARANKTIVALQRNHDGVRLEVRDDGVGFDPRTVSAAGLGLKNIEARARELGARCEIRSSPGKGTLVIVGIPGNQLYEPA